MVCKKQPGFILVFSMIFISMIIILSMIISNRGSLHVHYAKLMMDREKAKMLAYSGLQIAMAQLAINEAGRVTSAGSGGSGAVGAGGAGAGSPSQGSTNAWTDFEAKEFIEKVWPKMYEWQEFKLTRDKFGTDGVIRICICAEEGKININETFDFASTTRKFFGADQSNNNYKKFYEEIFKRFGGYIEGDVAKMFEYFEGYMKDKAKFDKILKNRLNKLYDTTEFFRLDIKEKKDGFAGFNDKIFYEPQEQIVEKGKTVKTVQSIYWTDIFTIWSGKNTISPWFISPSLKKLLKFKDIDLKNKAKGMAEKFKSSLSLTTDWQTFFEPIFGVKYTALPAWAKFVFDGNFNPKFFSVISYGKIEDVSHKIFAIIERKKAKDSENKIVVKFDIIKIYWV